MMYDSSDRGLASMTRAAAMAVALCFSALAPAVAADQPPTPAPAMTPSPRRLPRASSMIIAPWVWLRARW